MVKLNSAHITFQELETVVELLSHISGFDLSGYSKSSLKRRVQRLMDLEKLNLHELKDAIINLEGFQTYFMDQVTVNVTEIFRDPNYYAAVRDLVFPYLETFPQLKFWSAGCSTGEEVYSLTILLTEAGLYNRSFIYGTDINLSVIETAKKAIYPIRKMKQYSENYLISGGKNSLSDYYTAMYESAIIHSDLRRNIFFSQHNLVTDSVFNEFNFISCRNVLIYFDLELQNRVIKLLYESLCEFGFLCLGAKETLFNREMMANFKLINQTYNIYQKIK
ncbi:MAG: CheR family methyltransferase [Sphingobacterium sp.]|uniref:CheR family methyltransferase n=1 Tax=Sphingobacterium sp. JB170 TaxID=1434842 RepID=UPI00097F2AB5|nr:protein-glutamate O-methyltransferase CheR [Sphingobacterium sp. JB170]SJN32654.1 Chemotaxis protein methyltransferase CheR [Sphingobacterium sp. JB170]